MCVAGSEICRLRSEQLCFQFPSANRMGNQTSVLLEASSTGNLQKVLQTLDKPGVSDVNRKGQVKLTCISSGMSSGCADHLHFAAIAVTIVCAGIIKQTAPAASAAPPACSALGKLTS